MFQESPILAGTTTLLGSVKTTIELFKAQSKDPIIIFLRTTATVAVAGQQIQAPVRGFNNVTQSAELPVK
jgi:hypothetical protein